MSDAENTNSHFSNSFGSVFNNRVEFKVKKRWWSGGSHEELPLRHVTSVRVETSRSIVGGILLVLVGLGFLATGEVGMMFVGLVFGAVALLLLIGHPSVRINTAGQDTRNIAGAPGSNSEAERFIAAIREKLYDAK